MSARSTRCRSATTSASRPASRRSSTGPRALERAGRALRRRAQLHRVPGLPVAALLRPLRPARRLRRDSRLRYRRPRGRRLLHSFAMLMIGRVVVGAGVGSASRSTLCIAELPAGQRGMLVSYSEVGINVGITLGFVSDFAFSGLPPSASWRAMLGVGLLPLVILAIAASSSRRVGSSRRVARATLSDVLTTLAGPQARPADVALSLAAVEEEVRRTSGSDGRRLALPPRAEHRAAADVAGGRGRRRRAADCGHRRHPVLYAVPPRAVGRAGSRRALRDPGRSGRLQAGMRLRVGHVPR